MDWERGWGWGGGGGGAEVILTLDSGAWPWGLSNGLSQTSASAVLTVRLPNGPRFVSGPSWHCRRRQASIKKPSGGRGQDRTGTTQEPEPFGDTAVAEAVAVLAVGLGIGVAVAVAQTSGRDDSECVERE